MLNKSIRLIELFAGYGSQALALEYLKIPFEHWFVCDFDKYAIQSYNDIHNTNYSPIDITKINADDLNIVDTNNYDYLLTYSFPCTDLSVAGKQLGMQKGSGTRSGLLWEVERLLKECKELPQYLLMENVPQVIGNKNINDFRNWCQFLTELGYTNSYKLLNAKDFGIPQNRERCCMVSILNGKKFKFPDKRPLKLRLKDMLDDNVDDKYYVKKDIKFLNETTHYFWYNNNSQGERVYKLNSISPTISCMGLGRFKLIDNKGIREPTEIECLRLMGVKDKEINKFTVSDSQKYKQAGNSIVINVLMAIFKNLFIDKQYENTLF